MNVTANGKNHTDNGAMTSSLCPIVVCGNTQLTVKAESGEGIFINSGLTIKDEAKIDVTAKNDAGIIIHQLNISDNAELKATTNNKDKYALDIQGARSTKSIISGGTVTLKNTAGGKGLHTTCDVEITSGKVDVDYIHVAGGNLTLDGGELKVDNYESNTGFIYKSGKITGNAAPQLLEGKIKLESELPAVTYNGNAQIPSVIVKLESNTLQSSDYDLSWNAAAGSYLTDNLPVNAGTYYPVVTVKESAGFTGSFELHNYPLIIKKKILRTSLEGEKTKTYDGTTSWTGSAKLNGVETKDANNVTLNVNGSFQYDSPNVGTNKKIVAATGTSLAIAGSAADNYELRNNKVELSDASIQPATLTANVQQNGVLIYKGIQQKAMVSIVANGISGESYSSNNIAGFAIKYGTSDNNVNLTEVPAFTEAGEYTVYYEITATNYNPVKGQFKVKINKASLDNVTFTLDNAGKTYNGSAQAPTLKASIGQNEVEIPNGTYTLSYSKTDQENAGETPASKAVNAGTYTVIVNVNGANNFADGTKTAVTSFVISPKALGDSTIAISFDKNQFAYNTQEQKPGTITVKDSETGTTLEAGTDYTVTEPDNMVDANTYEYIFTGKGNYQGTTTGSVTIAPKSLADAEVVVQDTGEYVYQASPWTPGKDVVTVKIGDLVVDPSEYQLEYKDNVNAGIATVIVKANQDSNVSDSTLPENYIGSAEGTFTIKKALLKVTGAQLAPKTYDGTNSAGVSGVIFTEMQGEEQLVLNRDYTAEASFVDANAGTGKTYYVKAALKDTSVADNYQFLSEEDSEITLDDGVISKAAAQSLSDINVSYSIGRTGEQTVQITGLPEDMGEFLGAEAAVAEDAIDALEPDVTVDGDQVIFKLSGNKMENIGKSAKITISNIATVNYENMTQDIVITMDPKKPQDAVSCSMEYGANADEETFTAVITPVEGAEYSFDGENWSENNKKTDCQSDLEYTGYIRMKETEELYAGTISSMTAKAPIATVKAPVISPDETYIQKAITVGLSTSTGNAVIYYTLDGTDPTRESNRYTGPFTVDTGLKVKAIAVRDHFADSSVTEREYVWISNSEGNIGQEISKTTQTSQSKAEVSRIDDQKGAINDLTGIITGEGEGYSRWEAVTPAAAAGTAANSAASQEWKLRYADGTYASGTVKTNPDGSTYVDYCWEQVNGQWYAFNADATVQNGWIYDTNLSNWFYADANQGMKTGWQMIDGKWYYFHMVSDGTKGRMYTSSRTPDGYYVKEDGSWDEEKGV